MDVSIIICTRDRAGSLSATLTALQSVAIPHGAEVELIVADNGSKDDTRRVSENCSLPGMKIRYLYEPRQGQAITRNTAIKTANAEIILFTDDDVRPTEPWLIRHLEAYTNPDISAVVGRVELEFDTEPPSWLSKVHRLALAEADRGESIDLDHKEHLVGANMSFRREVWEKIGGFRTMLGPGRAGFWDDSDFSRRSMRAGYRHCYHPGAMVFHQIASERLTPAYFRNVAFRNGVSSFIAQQLASEPPQPVSRFLRSTARETRRRLRERLAGKRTVSGPEEMFYLMECGSLWARMSGMRRLRRVFGD